MHFYNTTNCKKIIVSIISILMLTVILYSSFYVAACTDHDCCGQHCQVCTILHQCVDNLNNMKDEMSDQLFSLIPVIAFAAGALYYTLLTTPRTPVSVKVRLND